MIIDIEKALKRELTPGATPGEEAYYRPKAQRTNEIPVVKRTVNRRGPRNGGAANIAKERLKVFNALMSRLDIMGCQAYVDKDGEIWIRIGNRTQLQKGLPCGESRPIAKTDRVATGREVEESWLGAFLLKC